jgi:hypothetical protein
MVQGVKITEHSLSSASTYYDLELFKMFLATDNMNDYMKHSNLNYGINYNKQLKNLPRIPP